jgi:hypothetical protein
LEQNKIGCTFTGLSGMTHQMGEGGTARPSNPESAQGDPAVTAW